MTAAGPVNARTTDSEMLLLKLNTTHFFK